MSIFTELTEGIATASAEETEAIAARLAACLPPECTLALHGDLGVGKTTFVRGLARAWDIPGPIASPTFNLCQIYRGRRLLVHLDAYRMRSAGEAEDLLIEDFLVPPFCLAVEWPQRIAAWLPADALRLDLAILSPGRHRIQLLR